MTYQEIERKVMSEPENFPSNIHPSDKKRYLQLEVETRFNDFHHINQGYNELLKDHKFGIINDCITRGTK